MVEKLIKSTSTFFFESILKLGALPLVLFYSALPENIFNSVAPRCIFKSIFEFECLGCGMSRAVRELMRLHFGSAIELNFLSPLALVLLFYISINEVFKIFKGGVPWLRFQ